MTKPRYLERPVREDLARKMVFVAGPRQVGKTTLARRILAGAEGIYLDWDNREDRREIRAARWPAGKALVVLGELHKWRAWRSWIKGEYDKHRDRLRFLVTRSARLDVYRKGGDSLQGRYHHYRLHPFSVGELAGRRDRQPPAPGGEIEIPSRASSETLENLMTFGGFPERCSPCGRRSASGWNL
jgi:predicted AAA+ superfamily ATPase